MPCPKEVSELVDRFARNREAYLSSGYNEEQLRNEFINPFFKSLGWDVYNERGYAEAYKDVIHEEAIKIGGATKAPDYSFRIGPARKFFVETKKPAVNVKEDADSVFQLRRYAWSANLPLSILTNFESFAAYDCRIKPNKDDKAPVGRILCINFQELPARWDEIYSIFSRDAVLKGSFDKYAESAKRKKGTAPVDDAFLKEIERWRDSLARNIALRNTALSPRELNFAIQQTIDRIIFLRICEDRGIETYGRLQSLLNGNRIYERLFELFYRADERYNSGLFHFGKEKTRSTEPDELTPSLAIDDTVLKEIIRNLYYPDSPYEFSVLPADILGQVYEQFLGKVIRLTPAHQAKVEDKPEVKKAGGVYYTPTYIVDYIVKNTVGKLLEGKNPKQAQNLKILDPACGSGSFLIGAYQHLLDWHLDWYIKSRGFQPAGKRSKTPVIYQTQGGGWRLTTSERKRILLNNVYGVDIDPQAVEVTKLSLLLKVLEGENQQSLDRQFKLLHERALPDLANNIKCGNSLIGPDFYDGKQKGLSFDEEERYRINAFDWQKEFPEIFTSSNPGFDAVIGNPPWGGDIDKITDYIRLAYPNSTQRYRDSFKLFMDKGLTLTSNRGIFSMIVPSAFMFQPRYTDVRSLIRKFRIISLWNVGDKVFGPRVTAPSCVFVVKKDAVQSNFVVSVLDTSSLAGNDEKAQAVQSPKYSNIPQSVYEKTTESAFVSYYREFSQNEIRLGIVLDCKDCGIKHQRVGVGMEEKGKSDLASRLYYEGKRQSPQDHKYVIGADLGKTGWFVDFSHERYFRGNYEKILRENEIVYFNEEVFDLPQKIVWRQTSDRICASIIGRHWFANTLQAGVPIDDKHDLRYVLGLLNSKFLNFIYRQTVREEGRVFPQVKLAKVRALPFRSIDFSNKADKSRHERMVELVELMLDLHKRLSAAKTEHEKTVLQRQIDATDKQIDNLVYELYGLTEEEIKIVEEGTGK